MTSFHRLNNILLIVLVFSINGCGSTAMKGSWQPGESHSPAANRLIGNWETSGTPFSLKLEPLSDTNGKIRFRYHDHCIVDENCLLSSYPVRPTLETEALSLRFFAEDLQGSGEPALEITGTVAGDSIKADVSFKYSKDVVTEVWHTTLRRVK